MDEESAFRKKRVLMFPAIEGVNRVEHRAFLWVNVDVVRAL